ncbi:MAG TPA: OmpH family outer membrane protein [Candidatus Kapabacteria bacterium]|nr:OmpH family outer membrane protein [Candidatus Kapabacteria bacterium]
MKKYLIIFISLICASNIMLAQRVGFFNSQTIREKLPDAQQAKQRVQSMTDEWQRELDAMQMKIDNLEFEIKKNRLVWTEVERLAKDTELQTLKKQRDENARQIFEPNGKYDNAVKTIFTSVEEKIYAAVQQVAADKSFDIIWDQSIQPLAYVNYKYDLTVHILKALGVEVEDLEKELKDKIDKDPRNIETESKAPRRRSRTGKQDDTNERQFDQDKHEQPVLDPNSTKELSKPKK